MSGFHLSYLSDFLGPPLTVLMMVGFMKMIFVFMEQWIGMMEKDMKGIGTKINLMALEQRPIREEGEKQEDGQRIFFRGQPLITK